MRSTDGLGGLDGVDGTLETADDGRMILMATLMVLMAALMILMVTPR